MRTNALATRHPSLWSIRKRMSLLLASPAVSGKLGLSPASTENSSAFQIFKQDPCCIGNDAPCEGVHRGFLLKRLTRLSGIDDANRPVFRKGFSTRAGAPELVNRDPEVRWTGSNIRLTKIG